MFCKQCGRETKRVKYCSRECYRLGSIGHPNRNTGRTWIKKGIIAWNKGKKLDENGKKKLSDAHRGIPLSEEHKKNIGKSSLGRKLSEEAKERMKKYKKDSVCYEGIHQRVYQLWGNATHCDICGDIEKKLYDWSNKDHKYLLNREDWQEACKNCHMKFDYKYNGRRNQHMIKDNLKSVDAN